MFDGDVSVAAAATIHSRNSSSITTPSCMRKSRMPPAVLRTDGWYSMCDHNRRNGSISCIRPPPTHPSFHVSCHGSFLCFRLQSVNITELRRGNLGAEGCSPTNTGFFCCVLTQSGPCLCGLPTGITHATIVIKHCWYFVVFCDNLYVRILYNFFCHPLISPPLHVNHSGCTCRVANREAAPSEGGRV